MNLRKQACALRARLGAKWCVVILLVPLAVFGGVHFGPRAATVLGLSLLLCMAASILPRALSGASWRWFNPGTLITGLLLGLTLSPTVPLYMIVVGALVAELAAKAPVPGLGRSLFNPAALGRGAIALLELADPPLKADAVSSASPLMVAAGGHPAPDYLKDLLFGLSKGAIGETSALLLLLVGIPLLLFVAPKREAPLSLIATTLLLVAVIPGSPDIAGPAPWALNPLVYATGGGTLLLAFFFATDPMTTPRTPAGGWIFGAGAAVIGVSGHLYTTIAGIGMGGILVMNLFTPAIDRLLAPARGGPPDPPRPRDPPACRQTLPPGGEFLRGPPGAAATGQDRFTRRGHRRDAGRLRRRTPPCAAWHPFRSGPR